MDEVEVSLQTEKRQYNTIISQKQAMLVFFRSGRNIGSGDTRDNASRTDRTTLLLTIIILSQKKDMIEVQRNKEERKMQPWKFPVKLFQLLQEATTSKTSGDCTIVSWLPDGSGFMILNHVDFEKTLMPKYFEKMSCYRSFRRQLNLYGIKKVIDFGGGKHGMRDRL